MLHKTDLILNKMCMLQFASPENMVTSAQYKLMLEFNNRFTK